MDGLAVDPTCCDMLDELASYTWTPRTCVEDAPASPFEEAMRLVIREAPTDR
jgi:hypothetical protein